MNVTLANGHTYPIESLLPPADHAHLFEHVRVFRDIECHLATAKAPDAKDHWSVLSQQPPSLQTFTLYGKRFGGIEPHFKDYESAAFEVLRSGLRHPQALTCSFMLLDCAMLIALLLGMLLVQSGQRSRLDWQGERGLSFPQLGLRELVRLCYERLPLPKLQALPKSNPPPVSASKRKRDTLDCRIEFSKVVRFS